MAKNITPVVKKPKPVPKPANTVKSIKPAVRNIDEKVFTTEEEALIQEAVDNYKLKIRNTVMMDEVQRRISELPLSKQGRY